MTVIAVETRESTPQGRLYPAYDTEADLLSVGSQVVRKWPIGINIDGRVILDADAERMLANFDLLIPRRYWKVGTKPLLSLHAREADLLLTEQSIRRKNFHLGLAVTTDTSRTWAYISFGKVQATHVWLKLSEQCLAELSDNNLIGFYIVL